MEKAYDTYQRTRMSPLWFGRITSTVPWTSGNAYARDQTRKALPEPIELSRQFLETVPTEAKRVRMEAEQNYQSQGKALEWSEEQVAQLKKKLLSQGYTGWPLEHCDSLGTMGSII
jgi:hypothetical protein